MLVLKLVRSPDPARPDPGHAEMWGMTLSSGHRVLVVRSGNETHWLWECDDSPTFAVVDEALRGLEWEERRC